MVCQSNVNRSMEAHDLLQRNGFSNISSFGAGTKVKIPGESPNEPNVYDFGTPYDDIYQDLLRKNEMRYARLDASAGLVRSYQANGD